MFDSGVGGLTVLRALRSVLPAQDFVYLGDTARLPYGTKSASTVLRYSLQCAAVLKRYDLRCLVVACNTASGSALAALQAAHPDLPVIGVIEPGAAAAVEVSTRQSIAVIATEGTIVGGAYQAAIHRLNRGARVVGHACSLFVALAEEGITDGPIAAAVARHYLDPVFECAAPPDTLVLGCTHFPLLKDAIRAVLPAAVRIVDSADTTAASVVAQVGPMAGATTAARGEILWLATDGAARFARVGSRFFGEPLSPAAVGIIDL